MKKIIQQYLTGERALFQGENLEIKDTIFADGEFPLKESSDIQLYGSIHNFFNAVFYPLSGALSNGLRAAGDVKFTMYVSISSTIGCRVLFSVILAIWLNLGVIGVAFAMCIDWGVRAFLFWKRFHSGRWKTFQVI